METPQLEDGYTRIANKIMDALIGYRIPGEERQCLDLIIRKTYGYNKKEDQISNSQFVVATGLKKGNVCRSIKNLISKNIVIKNDNKLIPTYRFNKDYKTWKLLSKKITVIKLTTGVIKSDNKLLSKVMDTKDIKDNIQKTIYPPISPRGDETGYSELFLNFWSLYPKKVSKGAAWKAWKKIKTPTTIFQAIKISLDKRKSSEQWVKDNGQYIPHPATWLNGRGWEDEINNIESDEFTQPPLSELLAP